LMPISRFLRLLIRFYLLIMVVCKGHMDTKRFLVILKGSYNYAKRTWKSKWNGKILPSCGIMEVQAKGIAVNLVELV
jgi:hypothetical protein